MRLGGAACAAAAAIFLLLCGCGGSSTSPFNATPQIGCVTGSIPQCGIFPASVGAGSQTFTLFINGANLLPQSQAMLDGSPRPTVFDQTTGELDMTIFAADVVQPGNANISVVNPEPSGPPASSNSVSLLIQPVSANAPAIDASSPFTPADAAAGGKAFSLAINGTNFASGDYVTWNGQVLQPAQLSATQIAVSIPATNIAACGFASIAVNSSAGIASPSVNFAIQGSCVPAISSISPASAAQGQAPASLSISGSNFTKTSLVLLNGSPRETTYSSATQLSAKPQASDVANLGAVTVTVVNPGGGISPSAPSPAGAPVNVLNVTLTGMARVARSSPATGSAASGSRGANSMDAGAPAASFPLLISATPSGAPPAVSADGRYVAFFSAARDLAAAGPAGNIFVRDTCLGVANCTPRTITVDSALDGSAANVPSSGELSMSADGRFVAFVSGATNLVPSATPTPAPENIYVRDLCEGPAAPAACVPRTILASPAADGALSGLASLSPSISTNGRFVAFVQRQPSGDQTVLVRDTCEGASAPPSCAPRNIVAAASGAQPAISANGRYVAFLRTSGTPENVVVLWDTCLGAHAECSPSLAPVSVANEGSSLLPGSESPSISADGRFVVFASESTRADGTLPTRPNRVFLRDTCLGAPASEGCQPSTTEIVPPAASPGDSESVAVPPFISPSGRFISFIRGIFPATDLWRTISPASLYVRDTCFAAPSGCTPRTVILPAGASAPSALAPSMFSASPLTADGRFVVFQSGSLLHGDLWLAPTGF
ncbi:MAG TPA: IPT/TIG domain-containing protein [Candidatus Acidoferrales bacterium]|nr:IPT/TIG domain-containing protein [Candidatus Acidoferrales bacterium]